MCTDGLTSISLSVTAFLTTWPAERLSSGTNTTRSPSTLAVQLSRYPSSRRSPLMNFSSTGRRKRSPLMKSLHTAQRTHPQHAPCICRKCASRRRWPLYLRRDPDQLEERSAPSPPHHACRKAGKLQCRSLCRSSVPLLRSRFLPLQI